MNTKIQEISYQSKTRKHNKKQTLLVPCTINAYLQTAKNKSWRSHLELAQLPNKPYVFYFCFNVDLILLIY
jgi:hypothetical protein